MKPNPRLILLKPNQCVADALLGVPAIIRVLRNTAFTDDAVNFLQLGSQGTFGGQGCTYTIRGRVRPKYRQLAISAMSSIAYMVELRYSLYQIRQTFVITAHMDSSGWRDRLQLAMKEKGLNMRSASIMAGKNHAYIYSLMKKQQEPNVDSLVEIANGIGISPIWLIFNINIDSETEKLILKYQSLDPKRQEIVRDMVSAINPDPSEPDDDKK